MKQMRQRIKNKTATFDRGCSDWISRAAVFCFRRFPRRDLALRWRRFDSSANATHTGRLPRSRRPSPASVINSPTKMWLERFSNRERPYSGSRFPAITRPARSPPVHRPQWRGRDRAWGVHAMRWRRSHRKRNRQRIAAHARRLRR